MLIQLNDRWRVIDSGPPSYRQWQLERVNGGIWLPKSFCQTRAALLVAINEKIIHAHRFYPGAKSMVVDPAALEAVKALPERIPQTKEGSDVHEQGEG